MLHQLYAPSPELEHLCSFYLSLKSTKRASQTIKFQLSPKGSVCLVIQNLRSSICINDVTTSKIFLIGQLSEPITIELKSINDGIIFIFFKPNNCYRLFSCSMESIKNSWIDIAELTNCLINSLSENTLNVLDINEKIKVIEHLLIQHQSSSHETANKIDHVLNEIIYSNGRESISRLSSKHSLSQRCIEKNFKERIGISPKKYSKILRFNYLISLLSPTETPCWMDLVEKCGYFDQPHLIRDFIELTGTTPSVYLSENRLFYDQLFLPSFAFIQYSY